jgi:hypothetical protein
LFTNTTTTQTISGVLNIFEVVTHSASAGMVTWLIEPESAGGANMLTADDFAVAAAVVVVGGIVVDVPIPKSIMIMAGTR